MGYETLRYAVAGSGVATITLDQPDTRNALSDALLDDLLAAFTAARDDDAVRCVVLTSSHETVFSSGGDLAGFAADVPLAHKYRGIDRFPRLFALMGQLGKPTLCAANGHVLAGALGLALACDLIVARESAYFLLAFVNIGLVPDGGSSLFIPARIGHTRATEMAMLGERIHAPQARDWGLINRVATDDAFEAEVDALAERLATGPTRAYAGAKRQLNAWSYAGMDEQLELEAATQQEMAASGDFMEGVQAFLAKRPPEFKGS
jgi:enoyl-CoA hydratase/carnithine racemase